MLVYGYTWSWGEAVRLETDHINLLRADKSSKIWEQTLRPLRDSDGKNWALTDSLRVSVVDIAIFTRCLRIVMDVHAPPWTQNRFSWEPHSFGPIYGLDGWYTGLRHHGGKYHNHKKHAN